MQLALMILACLAMAFCADAAWAAEKAPEDPLAAYNVSWDSPGKDFHSAVPIGNGDVGASLWVEGDGDLLFYIGKTDAYDDNTRLLKLGRVRVKLTPNPFARGAPFKETLKLRQGEIEIVAGEAGAEVVLRAWVDANHPAIRIEAEGNREFELRAALETWRTQQRNINADLSHSDALSGAPGGQPTIQYPDVIVPGEKDRVTWYHHNAHSVWPVTMQLQGLEACMKGAVDPLLDRTFGGAIKGEGLVRDGEAAVRSSAARRKFAVSVHVLAAHPTTADQWPRALDQTIARTEAVDLEAARAAHRQWWDEFWNRSWLRVRVPADGLPSAVTSQADGVVATKLPLRVGIDSSGGSRFLGKMACVRVWSKALPPEKLADLAARGRNHFVSKDPALVGEWAPGELAGGALANRASDGLSARAVGELKVVDADGAKVLEFGGKGHLEIPHDDRLNLAAGLTLEAWIAPDAIDSAGGRIIDKTPVGTSDGYLLDTWPGNSLRLIVRAGTVRHDAGLAPGRWAHVAGTFDPKTGQEALYVGGKAAARQTGGGPSAPPSVSAWAMSRGYALQRYLVACGGRGNMWIKFNGSIFTLPYEKDPDYRRWAGAQWFQNARLPYWPCIAAGDYDMMAPFYRHYVQDLPMARERTRIYYGHEGAFFPETQYFWGTYANADYGWDRRNVPLGFATNNYIRWYWSGCLELAVMMLDQYDNTQDREFLKGTLLPLAGAFLEFYDRHWKRGPDGKILFEPAQSLETWHAATDPLPEIAGLRYILPRMLDLPPDATTEAQRAAWKKTLADLPEVPTRTEGQKKFLLPARKFSNKANVENPELYAVWPYRLYGVGKPDLAVGIETFNRRQHRENRCWWQCDTHAAYLGLAGTAARNVLGRLCSWNTAFAFPAMWGPHNDEMPDMDHGGNGQMALQVMLMQTEGRKILLFPAWPKAWDVEFKLHAPMKTVVEGVYRNGKLEQLKVTPESRAADVVKMDPQ